MLGSQACPAHQRACHNQLPALGNMIVQCGSLGQRLGQHGQNGARSTSLVQRPVTAYQQPHSRLHRVAVHAGRKVAKTAADAPLTSASATDWAIGALIKEAETLPELSHVIAEWKDSFDHVKAAATFVKASSLARGRATPEAKAMLDDVADTWEKVQRDAGPWGITNVLWSCGKLRYLNPTPWGSTVAVFLQPSMLGQSKLMDVANALYGMAVISVETKGVIPGFSREDTKDAVKQPARTKDAVKQPEVLAQAYVIVTHPLLEGVTAQSISNVLWSCAKLRVCPEDHELVALVSALAKPRIHKQSAGQELANVLYAISELQRQHKSWRSPIRQQVWQRLLSDQQLRYLADHGSTQELVNVVLALARMATDIHPAMDVGFAQGCVRDLLQGRTAQHVSKWNAQDAANTMWSLAVLELTDQKQFLQRLLDAAESWLPRKVELETLHQVAWACWVLDCKNPAVFALVIKRCMLLLEALKARKRHDVRDTSMRTAALIVGLVASANVQHLADDSKKLLMSASSLWHGPLGSRSDAELWTFHIWLVHNNLLDGLGLQQSAGTL